MQASGKEKSSVGKDVVVQGELSGAEDVVFAGIIKGTVRLPQSRFTLESTGHADANITAKEVIVAGKLTGDIEGASQVQIRSTGAIHGSVRCERISIEEGATITGKIDMVANASVSAKGTQEQIALEMSVL